MTFEKFFGNNKVVIIGFLTAVALAVSELIKGGESSTKVLIFSAAIAAASWLARNLRGQWATITGLLGSALSTYLTMVQAGTVSWSQLILTLVVSLLAVLSAPAKSIGYEHTDIIMEAKKEGELTNPTSAPPNPPM